MRERKIKNMGTNKLEKQLGTAASKADAQVHCGFSIEENMRD